MASESKGAALTRSTSILYGIGLSAEGIKQNAFNVFLLFFYQQVAGLDPTLCGLALFLSLCVDAFVDPAIGAWSDRVTSRFGRRHPFMYAACIPLAVSYFAVFSPPRASQAVLFSWLLSFSVAARVSMSLFVIPHQSLVPELTSDPTRRTALMGLRTVFAWMFGLLNGLLGYTVFLKGTAEQPMGLMNRSAYPSFALFGAVTMCTTMALSAVGTQKVALGVGRVDATAHVPLRELPRALLRALRSPSYRAAVGAGLCLSVGYGLAENMNNYMNTFFWGFSPEQIGKFIVVIFFASLVVLAIARPLVARYETHHVAVGAALVMSFFSPTLVGLELAGVLPPPGDPRLFSVLSLGVFLLYGAIILGMTMIGSLIASVTDEHELETNTRGEGLLFSAALLVSKAASGIGVLLAGTILKLVQFPENAARVGVDPAVVRHLGEGSAVVGLVLGLGTAYCFSRFTLTRDKHAGVLRELAGRRGTDGGGYPAK